MAEAAAAEEAGGSFGHVAMEPGQGLSWEPLRPELVCEVAFDHLQGDRFRHAATFRRWRIDRSPADCRYDQLEETARRCSLTCSALSLRAATLAALAD